MALTHTVANLRLMRAALGAAAFSLRLEAKEGTLGATLRKARARKTLTFARDWTFARLLEWAAERYGDRPFLEFAGTTLTFSELNARANRLARGLAAAGVEPGHGVALMMGNHPDFLEIFFAIQKVGAYAVPVNVQLVGDGLQYVLEHSGVSVVFLDDAATEKLGPLRDRLTGIRTYYRAGASMGAERAAAGSEGPAADWLRPSDTLRSVADASNLGVEPAPESPALLMYTSGTTGLPKAVATPHGNTGLKKLGFASRVFFGPTDKLYTCLPLFHANALMVTTMQALWVGIPVALGVRFSASRFWKEVAESGATSFNALGAMIPILLKTPPSEFDRAHRVRRVLSSACPAGDWEPFEQRFGVRLWEAYGAVDGGGFIVFNAGNAPVGSIGKPSFGAKYRLVDDAEQDVPDGQVGELIFYAGRDRDARVDYFKNAEASEAKMRDGWLRTGDLMRRDAKGYLYFVGRNTDSMRRRGENVSAYEVEKQVNSHPDVLESAAFGVPSELGEDEVMVCVTPVPGHRVDPAALRAYLGERLPKFAVPTYLEVLDALPKTETHRVMKSALKARGVTSATVRLDA